MTDTENTYKMLVQKHRTVSIPLFMYEVLVVLTNNIEGSITSHRRKFPKDCTLSSENAVAMHVYHPDQGFSMIVLPFDPDVGLVVHEAYHCVWRMMEWISADHENEIIAYLLGYITREIALFAAKIGTPKIPKVPKRVIAELQKEKNKKKLDKGQQVIVQ